MGDGEEHGVLLLGAKHYTSAVDMWAVGCIFAELLTLKPLFQGAEAKSTPNPFQLDQLDKIFKVLGHPTQEKWPTLVNLPHWQSDLQHIQGHKYETNQLHSIVHLSPKSAAFDLLSKMLEYDPQKRLTAAQALEHEYFRMEPLPGRNALVATQPGEKVINYPVRPVDTNTDFEGTTSLQPPQQMVSGNARMQPEGIAAYNLQSQGGIPGGMPILRGVAQAHQQPRLRRKDPPMGTGYPPQQRSRRQ
ncbi:Cyclin-dependent kinase E-1 [Linum perenne]